MDDEIVGEPEAHDGLAGDLEIAVAGEAGSCGSGTSAGETADEKTDAA